MQLVCTMLCLPPNIFVCALCKPIEKKWVWSWKSTSKMHLHANFPFRSWRESLLKFTSNGQAISVCTKSCGQCYCVNWKILNSTTTTTKNRSGLWVRSSNTTCKILFKKNHASIYTCGGYIHRIGRSSNSRLCRKATEINLWNTEERKKSGS